MASLMVVELRYRAKQILNENLNSPKSMETYLSVLHFKWCDHPPQGLSVEPRLVIRSLVPICTRRPKPVGEVVGVSVNLVA